MSDAPPLQRFVFAELTPEKGWRGLSGPSLAGLSDHQLRKLIGQLQDELERLEAEAQATVKSAHEEGIQLGLEQARAEVASALLSATDCVNDSLDNLSEEITSRFETVVRDSASLAFTIGEHLAAQALKLGPISAIEGALNSVLAEMHQITALEIEVHPSLVEPLEASLQTQSALSRKLTLSIHADDTLAVGDAQISWGQGGVKVDFAGRRQAILEALAVILPEEQSQVAT